MATPNTSRKFPLAFNTSSYGLPGNGRDYTVWSLWESTTQGDHPTLQMGEVLKVHPDQMLYDDEVNIGGSTSDEDYFRMTMALEGFENFGLGGTGVGFHSTNNNILFQVNTELFFSLQDLDISLRNNSTAFFSTVRIRAGSSKMIGCIMPDVVNNGTGSTSGIDIGVNATNSVIVNCIQWNSQGSTINVSSGTTNGYVYNTTVIGGDRGIRTTGVGIITCKNTISRGARIADFESSDFTGSTNNASGDGTAPGTNSRINQTFTFVNEAGDDYHLALTDAGARNFGLDLNSPPDTIFDYDDDIDMELIDVWDIGADEPEPIGIPPRDDFELQFAGDTFIDIPGFPIDASLDSKITYQAERDDSVDHHDVWGADDGNHYGRWRSQEDFRTFRGGLGANLTTLDTTPGIRYFVIEEVIPAGTIKVTISITEGGTDPNQTSTSIGSTGATTGARIGNRISGNFFTGRIRDFSLFDAGGTEIHRWPIDDNVVDGGEITDVIGSAHGTLTLGTGFWVDLTAAVASFPAVWHTQKGIN